MSTDAESLAGPPPRDRRRRSPRSGKPPSLPTLYVWSVCLPSLLIYFDAAASLTLGFVAATVGFWLWNGAPPVKRGGAMLVPAVLAIVVGHMAIAATFQPIELGRSIASLVPLLALLTSAAFVASVLPLAPEAPLHRGLKRCFVLFCVLGIFGITGLQPPSPMEWRKSIFPFFEPAIFALPFIPLLMYVCVTSSGRTRLVTLGIGLACIALIQNLTLATGFMLVAAVSFRWRVLLFVSLLFVVGGAQLDLAYYADRLDFSGEGQNFSNLVYVQGWQLIGESWTRSGGFGLGFQQLGVHGTDVPAAELLRALREGEDLNVLDGGFVFSKLSSEFGLLGIVLGSAFAAFAVRSFRALRALSAGIRRAPAYVTLAHCSVLAYSVELFVRGTSYFTGTTVLLLASLLALHRQQMPRLVVSRRRTARLAPQP